MLWTGVIRAHPGMAATNLLRPAGERPWIEALQRRVVNLLSQSEEDGALPTLYAAVADIPGNSYAGPTGFLQTRGGARLVGRSAAARDDALARRLWTASEQLTGVTFPLTGSIRNAGAPL
ncbi:hypothetical protein O7626_41360 [Micromonospora sp. WMMD1102]|uniref:hypothetical protein n=1 Tax=Micromonospora sp. WMMD1102 TaxID=3016105 RepID=UPI0024154BFA|nr:hypothetical protein [Micromonospora sp. WMMD1102]MDG4791052.1 hypothetical protein [Micromonospora sp. WMMD1102]MDG4792240.1 hypothetical protein [Micromonospora sp. WMMD1102]MDG4792255.1 hypothetical protein [Micromonospora sp. WMMD1102]